MHDDDKLFNRLAIREWLWSWQGTSLAGLVAGAAVGSGIVGDGQNCTGPFGAVLGAFGGYVYAGFIGCLVFSTIAALLWRSYVPNWGRRLLLAVAGGTTGAICALTIAGGNYAGFLCCIGMGAAGAFLPVAITGQQQPAARPRVQFSLHELFLRTMVIAVLIVVWKFLIQTFSIL